MSSILQNQMYLSSSSGDEFNVVTVTNRFNTVDEFFSFYENIFISGPQFGKTYFIFINNSSLKNIDKNLVNKRLIELISEYLDLSTIGIDINITDDPLYYIERDIYKISTPKKKTRTDIPNAPARKRSK